MVHIKGFCSIKKKHSFLQTLWIGLLFRSINVMKGSSKNDSMYTATPSAVRSVIAAIDSGMCTTGFGVVVGPGTGDNMGAALGLGLGHGDIVGIVA